MQLKGWGKGSIGPSRAREKGNAFHMEKKLIFQGAKNHRGVGVGHSKGLEMGGF